MLLEPPSDFAHGVPAIALLAYGGIFGPAVALWTSVSAIRDLVPVTSSVGLLGGPVIAVTTSDLFLDEALTLGGGLVLILSGIGMVSLAQARTGGTERYLARNFAGNRFAEDGTGRCRTKSA